MTTKENLSLAKQDKYIAQITKQIDAKRALLFGKQKELKHAKKNNPYLEDVYNDYTTYINSIIGEKDAQLKAMDILLKYLDKLSEEDGVDKKELKQDETRIMREIDGIKKQHNKST